MTITLPAELEELVNEKVKSGAYKSADEVVTASLRLLKAQEKGMEALRREIMRGVEDIQQGRSTAITTEAELYGSYTKKWIACQYRVAVAGGFLASPKPARYRHAVLTRAMLPNRYLGVRCI